MADEHGAHGRPPRDQGRAVLRGASGTTAVEAEAGLAIARQPSARAGGDSRGPAGEPCRRVPRPTASQRRVAAALPAVVDREPGADPHAGVRRAASGRRRRRRRSSARGAAPAGRARPSAANASTRPNAHAGDRSRGARAARSRARPRVANGACARRRPMIPATTGAAPEVPHPAPKPPPSCEVGMQAGAASFTQSPRLE